MQTKKQNRTGDCSITGIVNKAKEIYKKSNVKNPLSTGNKAGDYVLVKTPLAKNWNKGFNIGKGAFIVKQTYDETCRTKKK